MIYCILHDFIGKGVFELTRLFLLKAFLVDLMKCCPVRLVRSPIDKTDPRVSESSDFRSVTDSRKSSII